MCKARDLAIDWVVEEEKKLIQTAENEFGMVLQYPDKAPFKEAVQAAYLNNKDFSGSWDLELLEKINQLGESMA